MISFQPIGGEAMSKFRKKGQLFIEYIIVFPFMIMSVWLVLQLIVYVYANIQVNSAAGGGADIVAQQLRGTETKITSLSNSEQIIDDLYTRLEQSIGSNGFILFSRDSDDNNVSQGDFTIVIEDEGSCQSTIDSADALRVICVHTKTVQVGSRNHDQIQVRVKVPFNIIGNFVPFAQDRIFLYGSGVVTKDISGRFQYYN